MKSKKIMYSDIRLTTVVFPDAFCPIIPTVENTKRSSAISISSNSLSAAVLLAIGKKEM